MFVVIEGVDFAGKTALAERLAGTLVEKGKRVRLIRSPGYDSAAGRLIHAIFDGKETFDPAAMLWLFVAEAKDLDGYIRQARDDGTWVICDRHTLISGRVYQSKVHDRDKVETVLRAAGLLAPDRIYVLDVPVSIAAERQAARGVINALYETRDQERLEALRDAYRTLVSNNLAGCRPGVGVLLDGEAPLADNVRVILCDLGVGT
jgi:dTMP kinase